MILTSDLHIYHNNCCIRRAEERPFTNVDEMHELLRENWNRKVTQNEIVYILGDVFLCNKEKLLHGIKFLKSLNGKKHLIVGNHDRPYLKIPEFRESFVLIKDYLEIKYEKKNIILFHFPIQSWHKKEYGSYHFHGHLHSKNENVNSRKYDVGLEGSIEFSPYNIEELFDIVDELVNEKDVSKR